ncbi:hypothetical protein [Thauera sp.]|uniref:hypothetical protein n=1 Tax=Thauera sp. TaxID=1905334 RepID=UPI0039E4E464
MDDWLVKLIAPVLAAAAGVYLGFLQGRWSKYREIIYAKKIEIYGNLVTQLLEFTSLCAPNDKLTMDQYAKVVSGFIETQNAFFRASLFMPEALHRDIQIAFTPANDRIARIHATLDSLKKMRNGEAKSEQELGVQDYAEFKTRTLGALEDLKGLPGPFLPLVQEAPRMVKMLKKDLGISTLDSRFYEKAP